MNTADYLHENDPQTDYTTAHIDAQDESYILPIREYLETHGVIAVVNNIFRGEPLYHIVAGDASFVKQIFSRTHAVHVKKLGIVLGGGKKQEEFSGTIKIVTARPTPMTPSEVMEVFEFFFTEGKNHLDLRPRQETRTIHEMDQVSEDHARVKSILADVYKGSKRPRKKRLGAWFLGALMGIGLLVIPTLWYGVCVIIGGISIVSGAKELRQGNFNVVAWDIRVADYWVHQSDFVLNIATVPLSWAGWQDVLRGQQRLVSFMRDATQAEFEAAALTALAGRVATGLLNQVDAGSTGTTAASDVSLLRVSLYTLGNTMGLAQAELTMLLTDRTFPFSINSLYTKGTSAVGDLETIRQSTADVDKLLSLFLSLAGFREPRTYLILLQNSMELRPTGGFIGSVAIASFADGRLTNLDVEDVYTFDGQLKGHVDPPIPIKELLGQEHWYLRDSNWDPDFKEAGQRAAWFYEKETGTTVDGVIAVNTPFITEILSATGPIDLSDYHDRITADNFYGKSIYYTQNDFFPGSTQKKDFLGSLSRSLLTTITSNKGVNPAKLFKAIMNALAAHDLTMMFHDPDLQSLVEHYGWAGRVSGESGCAGTDPSTCTFDPLVINEANMGVNKANYFVTRSLDRTITIHDDGTRTETVAANFQNGSGQSNSMPYRAYVRVVLPPGSSLAGVNIDGATLALRKGTTPPTLPYAETTSVSSGAYTLGIAMEVPASSDKKLTVSYTVGRPLVFGTSGAALDAFIQKQGGISNEPVHTTINYPTGWTVGREDQSSTTGATNFIAKQGQLGYNTILVSDTNTRVRFTK